MKRDSLLFSHSLLRPILTMVPHYHVFCCFLLVKIIIKFSIILKVPGGRDPFMEVPLYHISYYNRSRSFLAEGARAARQIDSFSAELVESNIGARFKQWT